MHQSRKAAVPFCADLAEAYRNDLAASHSDLAAASRTNLTAPSRINLTAPSCADLAKLRHHLVLISQHHFAPISQHHLVPISQPKMWHVMTTAVNGAFLQHPQTWHCKLHWCASMHQHTLAVVGAPQPMGSQPWGNYTAKHSPFFCFALQLATKHAARAPVPAPNSKLCKGKCLFLAWG